MLSESSELPEVFSSMEKCLLHQALRLGDPLIKLLELRFVSSSSETSRGSGTIQTSQSSISSHPVFPDVAKGTQENRNKTNILSQGPPSEPSSEPPDDEFPRNDTRSPQSTESPASLDRPIGAIFECLKGSKRPVYTLQLQYSVKVATSSYTVQLKYVLVYPGSYISKVGL